MHRDLDVVVPVVSDSPLVAELASDHVGSSQRIACDDARLIACSAVMASETSFIDLIAALLTVPETQVLIDGVVHVDVQNPISDVVSLVSTDQVLVWKWDFKRRRNVSLLEI